MNVFVPTEEVIAAETIDRLPKPPDERRLQAQRLFDSGLVGILFWNIHGVQDANDTLLQMLGYTRDSLLSEPINWIELTPLRFREKDKQAMADLYAVGSHFPFEKEYLRVDGTLLPVIIASLFNEGSETEGTTVVVNISAQKRAEKEQERLYEEQKRLLDEQGRLLAELQEAGARQRRFLKEMLAGFTEGRLRLCFSEGELPVKLPPRAGTIALSPQTLRQFRQSVEAAAVDLQVPDERLYDLITAVGEGAMNAVRHGGGGTGSVGTDTEKCFTQIWIQDAGKGIREEDIHRATLEKGWSGAGSFGHGFYLMLKSVDRAYLLTGDTGTTLVLEQQVVQPESQWLQDIPGMD